MLVDAKVDAVPDLSEHDSTSFVSSDLGVTAGSLSTVSFHRNYQPSYQRSLGLHVV